jgi:hypothetical protein
MAKKLRFKSDGVPTRMIFDLAGFDRMTRRTFRPIQDDFSSRKNAEKTTVADEVKLRANQVKPDARTAIIAATFDAATSAAVRARRKTASRASPLSCSYPRRIGLSRSLRTSKRPSASTGR